MVGGVVSPRIEGTPQGGPLSPLLPNVLLDDLDKELERRWHAFCRYADDCNIYIKSKRAGQRVLASIAQFLTAKLRLPLLPDPHETICFKLSHVALAFHLFFRLR